MLTRFGSNLAMLVWLGTLILFVDIPGNTVNTGSVSDLYFFKSMLDALLILWTCGMIWGSGSVTTAAKASAQSTEVFDIKSLGAVEYIYFAIMTIYGLVNLYFHHEINASSTGATSVLTLFWAFFDLAVAALSAMQFYQMTQGTLVRVTKQIIQH